MRRQEQESSSSEDDEDEDDESYEEDKQSTSSGEDMDPEVAKLISQVEKNITKINTKIDHSIYMKDLVKQ